MKHNTQTSYKMHELHMNLSYYRSVHWEKSFVNIKPEFCRICITIWEQRSKRIAFVFCICILYYTLYNIYYYVIRKTGQY